MNDELKGSDGGLIVVLSSHFLGGAEENYENLRHDTWYPNSDLSLAPPELKS
jgi:hypothetical protein